MENGATFPKLSIVPVSNGYGVIATEDIADGEIFVDIPAKLALNELNLNASSVIGAVGRELRERHNSGTVECMDCNVCDDGDV